MAARSEKEAQDMIRICRIFQYHAHASFGGESTITKAALGGLFSNEQLNNNINAVQNGGEIDNSPDAIIAPLLNTEQINALSNSNNFVSIPDLCVFKYMTGSEQNPYINQYKACAITNVDVNFTPDGSYSTLIGGYPSAVELSLTLVETKIIYKDQINTGLGVSN